MDIEDARGCIAVCVAKLQRYDKSPQAADELEEAVRTLCAYADHERQQLLAKLEYMEPEAFAARHARVETRRANAAEDRIKGILAAVTKIEQDIRSMTWLSPLAADEANRFTQNIASVLSAIILVDGARPNV